MEFTQAPNVPVNTTKSEQEPTHGIGDRALYYNKWDKYIKEETKK